MSRVKSGAISPGLALEDYTAAHYIDGVLYQIVTEKAGKKAFEVTADGLREISVTLVS